MATIGLEGRRPAAFQPRIALRRFLSPGNLVPLLLLVVVAFLVVYPLIKVVQAAFLNVAPGQAGAYTLDGWRAVFADGSNFKVLWTTFLIAFPRALLGLTVATFFAWVVARTNTPFKPALEGMLAFMFFLPDLPWLLAWTLLGSPDVGLLNKWLSAILPGDVSLVNVYSYWGLVILGAARSAPVLFLFVYPAFLAMDATLEESSRMSGASAWKTILRVNVPLLMPALLASGILSFVRSMESFEMEQILGTPAKIFVFTTRIYDLIYGRHIAIYGQAMVLALILLVLTFSLVLLQLKMLRGRSFTTMSGRGFKAKPLELGKWRWVTFSSIVLFFLVFGVLPFVILTLNSFMRVSGFFSPELLTGRHWETVLGRASLVRSIKNTVIVGVGAATLGVLACSLLSYTVTRTQWKGRRVLDIVAWIPWAVPGIVIALGFLWAFVPLPIYGTLWLLVLVYVARGFPIGSRFFTSTMVQVGKELEESSRIHGASWTKTFINIWIPLLRPAFIGAWILLFVTAVRVLDSALLLAGPQTRVLSVDIFTLQTTGRADQASVLAIIQTGIIIGGYLLSRILLRGAGSRQQAG